MRFMQNSFTLDELDILWKKYAEAFFMRWLVAGKWVEEQPPHGQIATRAERAKVKEHKTFIEYVRGLN